jgi:hypothetical protein
MMIDAIAMTEVIRSASQGIGSPASHAIKLWSGGSAYGIANSRWDI